MCKAKAVALFSQDQEVSAIVEAMLAEQREGKRRADLVEAEYDRAIREVEASFNANMDALGGKLTARLNAMGITHGPGEHFAIEPQLQVVIVEPTKEAADRIRRAQARVDINEALDGLRNLANREVNQQ